jgi:CRP-like cAMP-binding protein
MSQPISQRPANRILTALDPQTWQQIEPKLERIQLQQRELLHDYDVPIEYVYFPENCVASIVGVMKDGTAVETATVGNEGMAGIMVFFGSDRMAAQAFCQVTGDAIRMKASDFRQILTAPSVHTIMGRYAQGFVTQIGQSSACNRMHAMTQRCARWLLQTHDRVARDEFGLTQDFIAQMLGVRRATVTEAAGALQEAGAIRYRHGKITVTDRPVLERMSCECYQIVAREFARLLHGIETPSVVPTELSEGGRTTVRAPSSDPASQ